MIKYAYTILYVPDVQKSIEFYEKAFEFQRKFITPEADYGEIISGETTIAFAKIALANSNLSNGFQESNIKEKPFGIEMGFTTDAIDQTVAKVIAAGGTQVEPAKTKPWGQIVAYVRDLDGFLIEICTEMQS